MISSAKLAATVVVLAFSTTAAAQNVQQQPQQPNQAPVYGQPNPGQPMGPGSMMHGQTGQMGQGLMMHDEQMHRHMMGMMQGCHRMMSHMSEMRPMQSPGR